MRWPGLAGWLLLGPKLGRLRLALLVGSSTNRRRTGFLAILRRLRRRLAVLLRESGGAGSTRWGRHSRRVELVSPRTRTGSAWSRWEALAGGRKPAGRRLVGKAAVG